MLQEMKDVTKSNLTCNPNTLKYVKPRPKVKIPTFSLDQLRGEFFFTIELLKIVKYKRNAEQREAKNREKLNNTKNAQFWDLKTWAWAWAPKLPWILAQLVAHRGTLLV